MSLPGESRRRVYEEEGVREEAGGIQRDSEQRKPKEVSLGSLAIIAIVLAIALPAILIACSNGESTPQTTAETTSQATPQTTAEAAPVPEINLFDATQAKRRKTSCGLFGSKSGPEFITLRERSLEGGGIGADILVDEASSKQNVRILGGFILWQVWPKKYFSVLV